MTLARARQARAVATLRVLIVGGDPLARAGLASLVAGDPGFTVVGEAASGDDPPALLRGYQPDVVLWDLGYTPSEEAERLASLEDPVASPVIALVADPRHAGEAWLAGARGVLLREASAPSILAALRAAAEGLAVLSPEVAPSVAPSLRGLPRALAEDLTPRELDVLRLVAAGALVLALGHPWGIHDAATAGVVMGVTLTRLAGSELDWIAVRLRLRPGYSGGPLLDASGRLVGINTMMTGPEAGLAAPAHRAAHFLRAALGSAGQGAA